MLGVISPLDRTDKLSANRAQRTPGLYSAHAVSKSADIPREANFSGPPSPARRPQATSPEEGKRALESTTVSAPSSPPRHKFSHAMPASKISNSSIINGASGHKAHHLPSRSAPHVALRETSSVDVPPVPSIMEATKNNRSLESTPSSKNKAISPDSLPSTPPIPTLITSALSSQISTPGSATSFQSATPRATGFKRSDLSLKLPANPHLGIDISAGNQAVPSPGRFLSPNVSNTGLLGSQASTPTAATHFQAISMQQQQLASSLDPWGMPLNVVLNQNALFPSATNDDVSGELDRLLGLLDVTLGVFAGGIKQYQAHLKGQPAAGLPLAAKRAKKSRNNADPRASDTEGFVSESN